jgi:mono/diheme cytochrome c family protein
MRRVLKWIGIILGGLLGLLVLGAIVIFVLSSLRFNKTYDVEAAAVTIPDDDEALARGAYLSNNVAPCTACHGENLGGMSFIDDSAFFTLHATNLTSGQGGISAAYSDEDWVRSVRHGVDPEGRALIIMPSHHFQFMSDKDLGAILAYVKSLPPVDNETPDPSPGPFGRIFAVLDSGLVIPASAIDHESPPPAAPAPGVTVEYGAYLVEMGTCADCHGPELNGQANVADDGSPSSNLTPSGELGGWTEEDFIQVIRTGVHLDGHPLLEPMLSAAIDHFGNQSDEELGAIFAYLQSLPPTENGF